MKAQHILMGVGLLVGVWLAFFGDKSVDDDVATAVVRSKPASSTASTTTSEERPVAVAATTGKSSSAKAERVVPIVAMVDRQKLISVGHVGLDGKKIDNKSPIFAMQSWVPPPPVEKKPKEELPPPPPAAPPLNFKFLGKKFEDGVWEVYLARGDASFIARPTSVIDGTYRVDSITTNAVVLTYLPLNQVQRLNIKG